jgi:hypothetical protein
MEIYINRYTMFNLSESRPKFIAIPDAKPGEGYDEWMNRSEAENPGMKMAPWTYEQTASLLANEMLHFYPSFEEWDSGYRREGPDPVYYENTYQGT